MLPRPSEFQGSHLLAGPSSPMLIRDRFHRLREIRIRKEANVGISNAYFERARGSPVHRPPSDQPTKCSPLLSSDTSVPVA